MFFDVHVEAYLRPFVWRHLSAYTCKRTFPKFDIICGRPDAEKENKKIDGNIPLPKKCKNACKAPDRERVSNGSPENINQG